MVVVNRSASSTPLDNRQSPVLVVALSLSLFHPLSLSLNNRKKTPHLHLHLHKAGKNFHETATISGFWNVLGHINGNALYNNTDPAFAEFVEYTKMRWGLVKKENKQHHIDRRTGRGMSTYIFVRDRATCCLKCEIIAAVLPYVAVVNS